MWIKLELKKTFSGTRSSLLVFWQVNFLHDICHKVHHHEDCMMPSTAVGKDSGADFSLHCMDNIWLYMEETVDLKTDFWEAEDILKKIKIKLGCHSWKRILRTQTELKDVTSMKVETSCTNHWKGKIDQFNANQTKISIFIQASTMIRIGASDIVKLTFLFTNNSRDINYISVCAKSTDTASEEREM